LFGKFYHFSFIGDHPGQPTRSGSPAWELGVGLNPSLKKIFLQYVSKRFGPGLIDGFGWLRMGPIGGFL